MGGRVAVIGAGMTRFCRRAKESGVELAASAVRMALEDAGLAMNDIECVCLATSLDALDGIHMMGEYLGAGAGAFRKPYMRQFVGGGSGIMCPILGWMHIASGKFRNCLVVAAAKMSSCRPHAAAAFTTMFDHIAERPLDLTLIHVLAMEMCRFMHVYGYTEEEIAEVSVLCKKNALDHPAAQVAERITVRDVMQSPVLAWPLKRLDINPTSDGACAIVLANEEIARSHCKHPVFIEGVGFRLDTSYWCTRELAFPRYVEQAARDAYEMAGIRRPEEEIDIWEPYDACDYKALHHMNALLLDCTGRKTRELLASGAFERDGSSPLCPSGGALGVGNPISAGGLLKVAELYFQLSGQAGKRQVKKDARRGVAQAWGNLLQVGTVIVMAGPGSQPGQRSRWSGIAAEDLTGTPIKETGDVFQIEYAPGIRYVWDNGYALTTYLDGMRKGKIRGSRCRSCGRMMVPARAFCESCNLQEINEYYDLADTGAVETFTLSRVDWDSSLLPDGSTNIFAVISIDGAGPGVGLVHRLGEVRPGEVKIGMRVKAVWRAEAERNGSILDIRYFRPMRSDEAAGPAPVRIEPVVPDSSSAKAFPGCIPVAYVYTAGRGGSRFYDDLARGELSGTWCESCRAVHIPPAAFCEVGMHSLDPERDARTLDPRRGTVLACTTVYENRAGEPLPRPQVVVQVGFEGAVGTIFGRIENVDPLAVRTGAAVELVKATKAGPEHITFRLID